MGKRIRCILHVPFETPGYIEKWARDKGHEISYTRLYEDQALPELQGTGLLLLMGGPMSAISEKENPWLAAEKKFLQEAFERQIPVLGICLGAQLIAASLGAKVYPASHREIGWYPLHFLPALGNYPICPSLPRSSAVFHWHGDTFDIPEGATRIASSKATPNQGFIYGDRVIALQFHLEIEAVNVEAMLHHCGDELAKGPYMQEADEIRKNQEHIPANTEILSCILEYLIGMGELS